MSVLDQDQEDPILRKRSPALSEKKICHKALINEKMRISSMIGKYNDRHSTEKRTQKHSYIDVICHIDGCSITGREMKNGLINDARIKWLAI